jgi:hypothetical protein
MKNYWRGIIGSVALSAAALSMIGTDGALAKGKSAVMKPTPPDDVTTTEKGIKDKGVSGCGNCGLTGREAAPPPADDGTAPASVEKGKSAVMKPTPPDDAAPSAERGKSGVLKPHDDGCNGCGAKKGKTGWIILSVAALAGGVAILASSGNDNPTSP